MTNSIEIQYYDSPYGNLIIGSYEGKLCLCDWTFRKQRDMIDSRIQKGLNAKFNEKTSLIVKSTISQLEEYFAKKRTEFDLPLLFVGTDFQKQVWNALLEVPFGKTETYGGLSKKMNNPKAVRAVAAANGANAISIIVPCHRVIGADGGLTGYGGGLPIKQYLLDLEKPHV